MTRRAASALCGALGASFIAACAAAAPYVRNESPLQLEMGSAVTEHLQYVRVERAGNQWLVYGRFEPGEAARCGTDGRVEVRVLDGVGGTRRDEHLPVFERSQKLHGWYGASFRTRVAQDPGAKVLAIDVRCEARGS